MNELIYLAMQIGALAMGIVVGKGVFLVYKLVNKRSSRSPIKFEKFENQVFDVQIKRN